MDHQKPPETRIGNRTFRWGQRTLVMGVINVTPDSFSGDGLGHDTEAAVAQGLRFVEEGADILDVGGESTRPPSSAGVERRLGVNARGATAVDVDEELRRVLPVVERLVARTSVPVSVDTYKREVARRAVQAGATLLNDVWGVATETNLAPVAAELGVPIILMHNQRGTDYQGDVVEAVIERLAAARDAALACGVPREHIILDPGFGFGKRPEHNLEVLRRFGEFQRLAQPLLLGTSRKSTLGLVTGTPPDQRVEATGATVALAIAQGVDIVRVHDVKAMVRVVRMADAVVRGWPPAPDHEGHRRGD